MTLLAFIWLFGLIAGAEGTHLTPGGSALDAKSLRQKLFTIDGYDRTVRPSTDYRYPTEVLVSFYLYSINGLNEAKESLQSTVCIYLSWHDSLLTWNKSDYGNLSDTFFPQNEVWRPDLALLNSLTEYKELGVSGLNVNVDSNGTVHWLPFQLFESYCAVDITNFPFDTQTCKYLFVAWSYNVEQVTLLIPGPGIALDSYQTNQVWEVASTSQEIDEEEGVSKAIFLIKLKRKPRFVLLNAVLPSVMLSILSVFTFLLPCESGEKAGYSITVFLSFAVFLTMITNSLPENSDTVSLFSIYLVIQTGQSTAIVVLAMLQIRISLYRPETPIPKFLRRLVQCFNCKTAFKRDVKVKPIENNGNNQTGKADDDFEVMPATFTTRKCTEARASGEHDWKEVVNALDIVFLCFFGILTVVCTLVCLVVVLVSA